MLIVKSMKWKTTIIGNCHNIYNASIIYTRSLGQTCIRHIKPSQDLLSDPNIRLISLELPENIMIHEYNLTCYNQWSVLICIYNVSVPNLVIPINNFILHFRICLCQGIRSTNTSTSSSFGQIAYSSK